MQHTTLPPGIVRENLHRHRIFVLDGLQHFGFTPNDILLIGRVDHLGYLGEIALKHIDRIGPFCIGIGPMTTGNPLRSVDQNFEFFRRTYLRIVSGTLPGPKTVFYQLLFEFAIKRIADQSYDRENNGAEFYNDLFRYLYGPIMNHEKLIAVWRMPDWTGSVGAQIEYDILTKREKVPTFYDALDHVPELQSLRV